MRVKVFKMMEYSLLIQINQNSIFLTKFEGEEAYTQESPIKSAVEGDEDYLIEFLDKDQKENEDDNGKFLEIAVYSVEAKKLSFIKCYLLNLQCQYGRYFYFYYLDEITNMFASPEGLYLLLEKSNQVALLDKHCNLDESKSLTYSKNIKKAVKFKNSWFGISDEGLFAMLITNEDELVESVRLRAGNFDDISITDSFLIGSYKEDDISYIVIFKENLKIIGNWKKFLLKNIPQNIHEIYEWHNFLIFYTRKNVVVFNFPISIKPPYGNFVFSNEAILHLNRGAVVDDGRLLAILPNSNRFYDGLALLEYEINLQSNDAKFYYRQMRLSKVRLNCEKAENEELLKTKIEMNIFYENEALQASRKNYMIFFVYGNNGPHRVLIAALAFFLLALCVIISLGVFNIVLVIKKNKGRQVERRLQLEYKLTV